MASEQWEEPAQSKDLTELIAVINVPSVLSEENQAALIFIAKQFLRSIEEREESSRLLADTWETVPAIQSLIDSKTGKVVVKNKEQADKAADLCRQIAGDMTVVKAACEKEISFFNRFHRRLTGARSAQCDRLDSLIDKLKDGNKRWFDAETARVALEQEAARKKQDEERAKLEKKATKAGIEIADLPPPAPPPTFEAPKIAGMTPSKKWAYTVTAMVPFVKAVLKSKQLLAIGINDTWMKAYVALNHDAAVQKDGKKYLFDGTVEVFQDTSMARRG